MISAEVEAYIRSHPPEVHSKANEREAQSHLDKLFYAARRAQPILRRFLAYAAAARVRPELPVVYWHSAPRDIQAIFQTNPYRNTGLTLEVPNPERSAEKQTVLKLKANGMVLAFVRTDTYGEKRYRAEFEMGTNSPLRVDQGAMQHAQFVARKIDEMNKDQASVLVLLAISASFAFAAHQTKGFTQGKPLTSYEKPPDLGFS